MLDYNLSWDVATVRSEIISYGNGQDGSPVPGVITIYNNDQEIEAPFVGEAVSVVPNGVIDSYCSMTNESSIPLISRVALPTFVGHNVGSKWVIRMLVDRNVLPGATMTLPWFGGERPHGGEGSGELMVQMNAPSLHIPASVITSPTPVRARVRCEGKIINEQSITTLHYQVSGTASAIVLPRTNVSLDMPSSITFNTISAGGHGVSELPLTIRSDGSFSGNLRYIADTPNITDAKIGDGHLRLAYSTGHSATGYADLSGNTSIPISGISGEKKLEHRVHIEVPANATLGTYLTKLRVILRFF